MKKLLILLMLTLLFSAVYSQFNNPEDEFDHYCIHQQRYLKNTYYEPLTQNPLLDYYDVKFYFLDLNIENNTVTLSGNVTINALVTAATLDTFACELIPEMTIDSAFVNGTMLAVEREEDDVLIPLSSGLVNGDMLSAQIYYHGTPPYSGFFSGVTTSYSSTWGKHVTWTLAEPYAAKEWWPTKQDLQDKADSCWVFLTTSDDNLAGSQGLLTAVTPMPNNKLRFEWKSNYPIDYYLISYAVAEYQEYNTYAYPDGYADSILIQNYIYDSPGCLSFYQSGIDQTSEFIELFSDLFSIYPFADEKYGHCLTQLGGGMEHQTMTTIGGFSFGLVAHELGHMWWGDNITCATWSDIWINEGFATYSDYLANEFINGYAAAQNWLLGRHNSVKSAPGGSVYVPPEQTWNIYRIFDGRLSYNKGSLLLHMIRFELQDDDMFFQVLHDYTAQYGDSTATGLDFKEVVEDVSGMDFTDFFDQWYFGEGYPIFDITWNQVDDSLNINSTQTTSTSITPLFKMLVPYYVKFSDGTDSTLLLYQTDNYNHYAVSLDKEVIQMQMDPEQWILHDLNSLIVGMEEVDNPVYFTFGPNPASDNIRLFLPNNHGEEVTFSITDLTGRMVMEEHIYGGEWQFDVSKLSKGIYLINITDGKNVLTRKFVRK